MSKRQKVDLSAIFLEDYESTPITPARTVAPLPNGTPLECEDPVDACRSLQLHSKEVIILDRLFLQCKVPYAISSNDIGRGWNTDYNFACLFQSSVYAIQQKSSCEWDTGTTAESSYCHVTIICVEQLTDSLIDSFTDSAH